MEDFTVQTSYVKLKNIFKSNDLDTHDFRWENVIFWGCTAWPNNELQKHINCLQMKRIYPNLLYSPTI